MTNADAALLYSRVGRVYFDSTLPDLYQSGSVRPTQLAQQPVFQSGSSSTQEIGPSQQNRHFRTHRKGKHPAHRSNRAARFGSRGGNSTSGQSLGQSSAGSGTSACGICGRVHQGPCTWCQEHALDVGSLDILPELVRTMDSSILSPRDHHHQWLSLRIRCHSSTRLSL